MKRSFKIGLVLCVLLYSCRFVNPIMINLENDKASVSTGESWSGDLENGKRLPNKGDNFHGISYLFTALGRNGVHEKLRDLTLEVYDSLYKIDSSWKFLYGETGWVNGGKFWPHYTHQNGLVIDFMVPVLDCEDSVSKELRTHIFNRFGYAYEFDSAARSGSRCINFEAMATHLYLLKVLGEKHDLKIKRIIFEPDYLPHLYATTHGSEIKDIIFTYNKAWVRHDDHYHTEFSLTR